MGGFFFLKKKKKKRERRVRVRRKEEERVGIGARRLGKKIKIIINRMIKTKLCNQTAGDFWTWAKLLPRPGLVPQPFPPFRTPALPSAMHVKKKGEIFLQCSMFFRNLVTIAPNVDHIRPRRLSYELSFIGRVCVCAIF
jgi:hypothetical protein